MSRNLRAHKLYSEITPDMKRLKGVGLWACCRKIQVINKTGCREHLEKERSFHLSIMTEFFFSSLWHPHTVVGVWMTSLFSLLLRLQLQRRLWPVACVRSILWCPNWISRKKHDDCHEAQIMGPYKDPDKLSLWGNHTCLSISAREGHANENTPTCCALVLHLKFLSLSKHFQMQTNAALSWRQALLSFQPPNFRLSQL